MQIIKTALFIMTLLVPAGLYAQGGAYEPTTLPNNVTNLWVSDGNTESDTVVLFSQGGPDDNLTFEKQGKSRLRYLPGYKNMHIAYVHQAQTFNKTILNSSVRLTRDQAKYEIEKTVDMLDLAVKHFRSRKKNVIVIGNSYGAFIVTNYLATRAPLADSYFILAGRVDDDLRLVEQHFSGRAGRYNETGESFIPSKTDPKKLKPLDANRFVVKQYLKWVLGNPRYSRMLSKRDLKKVTFFYGLKDRNVGRLTDEEVSFLKSRGAHVFATEADHYANFYKFIDAITEKRITLLGKR